MPTRVAFIVVIVMGAIPSVSAAEPAAGQSPAPPAKQPVQQTAFDRPAPGAMPAQSVRFGRRESRVGDQMEQNLAMEMRLTLNMRRASELIGKQQTTVRTNQRRIVTSVAAEGGRATKVRLQYVEATKQVVGDQELTADSTAAGSTPPESPPAPEPVQGKTYICYRDASAGAKLIVTDEAGDLPPADELEIVSQQMEMVGRPNPLADFLGGRTIVVGEKLELPNDVARQVFNLGKQLGEVTKFTLTLQKVQPDAGVSCAVFLASVEAASNDASPLRLQVEGPLAVQIESCRTARVDLSGPIVMSETRGTYSTAYQMIGTGRLHTRIASTYREAQR